MVKINLFALVTLFVFATSATAFAEGNQDSPTEAKYSMQLLVDGEASLPTTHQNWRLGRPIYLQSTMGENPYKGTPEQSVTFKATPELKDGKLYLTGTLSGRNGDKQVTSIQIDKELTNGKGIAIPFSIDGVEYSLRLKVSYSSPST